MYDDEDESFEVRGTVWLWKSAAKPDAAGWFFLTIEGQAAAEIRYAAMGGTGGFGSIRVDAAIGITRWQTSIFPHKESGGFILPLKADVRKREGISAGSEIDVTIAIAR